MNAGSALLVHCLAGLGLRYCLLFAAAWELLAGKSFVWQVNLSAAAAVAGGDAWHLLQAPCPQAFSEPLQTSQRIPHAVAVGELWSCPLSREVLAKQKHQEKNQRKPVSQHHNAPQNQKEKTQVPRSVLPAHRWGNCIPVDRHPLDCGFSFVPNYETQKRRTREAHGRRQRG